MTLKQLLEGVSYRLEHGTLDMNISDVVYDSRKAKPGCVFVCLEGSAVDGHRFAASAVQQGAVAVVARRPVEVGDATFILVEDTRYALALLSAAYFDHPADKLKMVGITGTKGKTTTTCMIQSVLQQAGIKTGLIGTLGVVLQDQVLKTENTTPESYEIQSYLHRMVQQGYQCCVMEASSLGLKWHRIAGFTFDLGVFTNFSPDHIAKHEHETLEEYLDCKRMLFCMCRVGLFNCDDPAFRQMLQGHTCQVETFGFQDGADLQAKHEALVSQKGYLGVQFDVANQLNFHVQVGIPGKFSVYNALAALSVCRHFGVSEEQMKQGLQYVKVKGRVEPVPVPGHYTMLIDYAHNAMSMENILTTLREYNPHRLICLFGAGGNRARSRRYEMGEMAGKLADLSVITADNSRDEDVMDIIADILVGTHKTNGQYVVIPDRKEAIRYCIEHAEDGDIIVLAGKGHEDYQEIKGVKYPFDERVIIQEILAEKKG